MIEVRQCIQCEHWFKKENMCQVTTDGKWKSRYSSVEAHMEYTTAYMCKKDFDALDN